MPFIFFYYLCNMILMNKWEFSDERTLSQSLMMHDVLYISYIASDKNDIALKLSLYVCVCVFDFYICVCLTSSKRGRLFSQKTYMS